MTPRQTYLRRLIAAWGVTRFRGMITRADGKRFNVIHFARDKFDARQRMMRHWGFRGWKVSRISFVGIERCGK